MAPGSEYGGEKQAFVSCSNLKELASSSPPAPEAMDKTLLIQVAEGLPASFQGWTRRAGLELNNRSSRGSVESESSRGQGKVGLGFNV
mmetsp:Transcript_47095/g.147412  ORF Transcript_47095/g.147412 Transcript_47095/m.147412 type:complete len:88 (-) Transcript_47095:2172-2435(-)